MDIAITNDRGQLAIRLNGSFDFEARREFAVVREKVLAESTRKIEINLAGVSYLDSSALGMLLILREKANAMGKSVSLGECSERVCGIIKVANFDRLFCCCPGA